MAGRTVTLSAAKGGINRLRIKGGASAETLYDLENGYVDASGVIRSRPGVPNVVTLPAGTKGLCAYAGKLIVFSHTAKVIPASTPTVECEIVIHPISPDLPLQEIHFAGPILGYLYVVAEFSNGDVYHYWLQSWGTWAANTHYLEGAVVQPSVPNGYAYRAKRLTAADPLWAPDVTRAIGDTVEPTEANGFKYTVVSVNGANPRSAAVEPDWAESDGALTYESADSDGAATTTATDSATTLPPDVVDRYGNLIGRVEP